MARSDERSPDLSSIHEKHDVEAKPQPSGPSPPPNGGLQAWLHVLAGFMLFFNSWGILNTFGVYQNFYSQGTLFANSSSDISWIGAIQSFILLAVGPIVGPIYDRGYLRSLLIVGSFMIVFGHMMLSLCHEYWQALLAQGFCIGIGAGCLFIPAVSILPTYFSSRIGLAIGLASSGSSLGGIIYPIVLYRLISRIGFPWSVRVLGFIALGTLLIPICIMKIRVKAAKPRAFIDFAAFKDLHYMLFVLASFIGFMGLIVALFYISYYAEQRHITDSELSFYLIPIFNAASCFGRTIPNWISDTTGPLNLIAPCAFVTGILILCLIPIQSVAGIVVAAVLIGFFSGVYIALPPVCFVALTADKSKIGTRIGMGFGIVGLGILAGGPSAGAILGTGESLDWSGAWALGGAASLCAGVLYVGLRISRYGYGIRIKA